jgi:uncharacterized protein DUF4157
VGTGGASEQWAAPGRTTLVQQLGDIAEASLVQRKETPGAAAAKAPDAVGRTAAAGVAVGGEQLPHLDRIQKLFGPAHDVTGISAHVGGQAAEAADQIGAEAYATGSSVAFRESPDLHTAAHEAAHVVQQRAGVHLKGGVGEAGDVYEQHADAVADRVVRGESAADLLGAGAAKQGATTAVQRAPNPLAADAAKVIKELDDAIAAGQWEVLRAKVYPREAASAHKRANDRRAGAIPDLAGLGSVVSLDSIATAIKALQGSWSGKAPKARGQAMIDAANVALTAAKVPEYLDHDIADMVPRGGFLPTLWTFLIRKATVEAPSLTSTEAGEVANVVAHESRHAEQHFLQARLLAGTKSAADIKAATGIPLPIAKEAVKQKMAAGDPRIAEAKTMDKAFGADGAANQAISANVNTVRDEMNRRRKVAEDARTKLAASATAGTLAAGRKACADLITQTNEMEKAYLAYRTIPYEADAHEVGDSESEAFSKLP